ncbi:esterase/lipase family protein [Streptomyces afghaniensis]|uniref:esterase/lipase family protein n=1 Tax=Streptomyces afghaniensis TaxID=66865 RepID=UPI0037A8017F
MAKDVSHDAVVIVPGIMGSSLQDTATGRIVWGLRTGPLRKAWCRRDGMAVLQLSDDERQGRFGRIRATGLLSVPAWAPYLKGLEPYGDLVEAVHAVTADRAAVLEFAYDWRLPVAVNGALLAEAARRHLTDWRGHARSRAHPDEREARLVFVAHSMGGLVTRAALTHAPDLEPDTRAVVTLGTPFLGSVKAAVILNGNRGEALPVLPKRRMQALSATLPGVHDLLPGYRCVETGLDVERLDPAVVERIGGDRELAEQSQAFRDSQRSAGRPLPAHRALVGVAQPTVQSMSVENGVVRPQFHAFELNGDRELARDRHGIPVRKDRGGDGTVYRDAAHPGTGQGQSVAYVPLQHGALAKNSVALRHVRAVITEYEPELGPPMGDGEVGLDVPDCAAPHAAWWLRLTGVDNPSGIACSVHDAETDRRLMTPRLEWRDEEIGAWITLPEPVLYRVRVNTGANAPITQLVMGVETDEDD